MQCPRCKGKGEVPCTYHPNKEKECEKCLGEGQVCSDCDAPLSDCCCKHDKLQWDSTLSDYYPKERL
jgi:hypothetical protein